MITFSLLIILATAYVVLKVLNMRAEFARRDAEMARREQEAQAAMEKMEDELAEEEEIRAKAIDVEAETIDNDELDDTVFEVEPAEEAEYFDEDRVVIEVPEYDTVR